MNVLIRKAVPGDEQVLAHIQTESWKAAFADILSPEELEHCTNLEKAEQMYHSVLRREGCNMAIALVNDQPHCIAAWGKNRCDLGDTVGELICIHSLQNNWAKGYGSAMMEYVLAQLQQEGYESVILWVFEANTRARKFYEKHGFALTEQKKLANGIAELMYMKDLYPYDREEVCEIIPTGVICEVTDNHGELTVVFRKNLEDNNAATI